MSLKKLGRVAIIAFALAALLAVSSLAVYTVTIDGTVEGIEDGIDYTAAQYDFASNAYGEFTELTSDTKLSAGVWGIKAGDTDPEVLFVQTDETGRISYWSEENGAPLGNFSDTITDTYLPGKWTRSSDGAFPLITWYNGGSVASVCIHVEKKLVLTPAKVAETVTVEEVDYPLYTIDGAEYYLKDEAYYAVADNALYEGEGEAVAVTVETWTGATPIIGEGNKLQESKYWYGFKNSEVFPASIFEGYTSYTFSPKVGALNYNEGYSAADFKPEVVIYTKTVGSEAVNEYTVDATYNTAKNNITVAKPEGLADDEYIVALAFLPYANLPDDFFVNGGANGTNSEARGYYHHYQALSLNNGVTVTPPEFDAPEGVTGGITVIEGLDDSKNYQMAYVYINSTGDGYTLGEWMPVDSETGDLAGLAVVRYCSEDGTVGSKTTDIFYINGNAQNRAVLSTLDAETGKIVAANGDAFEPGVWKGASCGVYEQPTGAYAVLDQGVGLQTNSQKLWLYQHTEAEADAIVTAQQSTGNYSASWVGGCKPEVMQQIIDEFYAEAAEKDADTLAAEEAELQTKIAASMEKRNFKYAYDNTEIIPADELNGFDITMRKRQGSEQLVGKVKVIFKVMDLEGNVTDYVWTSSDYTFPPDGSFTWKRIPVDAASVLANAEGYVVGLQIHPVGEIDDATITIGDGTYMAAGAISARFIQNQWQAGYYPDSYSINIPQYGKLEGISGGFGAIDGLEEGAHYQYALLNVNANGSGLQQGEWTDLGEETPAGLMIIRQVMLDGGTTDPSDIIYVYGSSIDRAALCGIDPSTGKIFAKGGTGFVTGYWTGNSACTHSTFRTYVVSTTGGGWVLTGNINAVKTAEATLAELKAAETPDADAIAAAEAEVLAKRQVFVNKSVGNWLYYGFNSDEIVPISELNTFAFITSVRQGITYTGAYESKAVVYIAKLDGTVAAYEHVTPAMAEGATRTLDFTDADAWTPALPSEGYVVGLKIDQWYGKSDPMKWNTPNTLNTMPAFEFLPDAYSIDAPALPPCAAPEGLYVENETVKGFDADVKYAYAVANANGIGEYNAIAEGTTEFTLDKAGLYAIIAMGDGISTDNSVPHMVFIPGDSRGDILHTTPMVGTNGKYKDVTINVLDQKSAGGFADNRKYPSFNEYYWTGMAIETALTLYYGYDPLNMGGTGCTVYITGLKAAIDKVAELEAAETPDADAIAAAEAELLAIEAGIVEKTNDVWYSYQYGADEIIPMEDFVSFKIKPWARQSGYVLSAGSYQTKFIFKVITEDGQLVDRVAYKNNVYGNGTGTVQTYTLSDFEETDGYIVGILVYPYGKASDDIRVKVNPTYPAGNVAADINLTLYTDGYKVVAPANAPEANVTAAIGGVNVHVTNAIEGATYAYSLDNKTWTNAPAALSTFTVIGATDVVYVKMLDYGNYLESAVSAIAVPAFKTAPQLVLGEGNVLADTTGLYEIAQFVFGTELTYEPLTEKTLTTGVWAVRTVGDDTAGASAPQIFYVEGDEVGSINYTAANGTSFAEGKWTMPAFTTMYKSGTDWATGIAEIHLNGVPYSFSGRRAFALRYQFTADEIIPVTDITDISSAAPAFYHGYIKDGYTAADGNGARSVSTHGQTLARVYVAGAAVPYYDIYTEITYSNGYKFEISDYLADKDGYIVALELYPLWSIYGADNKTDLGDNCVTALWLTSIATPAWSDYTFKLRFDNQFVENELPEGATLPTTNGWVSGLYADGTNRFALSVEKITPAAPALEINVKSQITITDYVASYKYQYSTDGGNTWADVPAKTFNAAKANTEYLVKVAASGNSYASEASAITSQPVAVVGSSLVLDGQIGTKIYFDIAEELVKLDTVTLHATKVNSDFPNNADTGALNRIYGYSSIGSNSKDWMTKLTYDEAQDLYYIIVSVPAKDADNTALETELNYYLADGTTKVVYGSVGYNFKVTSYIASAKALAEAGDEEFVEALDLINALEKYVTYADAYFNNKTVDAYATTATVDVEDPTRTNTTLDGVEFYGTSLILEDNVTIRHYFTVNDMSAFLAAGYVFDVDYGTKGDYVYFDITDIPAQELGALKTLNIKNANGSVIYSINYSAANYMASMMDDDNANLVSLVNAMYDYYLAAADYAK